MNDNNRATTVMVGIVAVVTITLLFLLVAMAVLIVSDDLDEVTSSGDSVVVALSAVTRPG